MTTPKRRLSRSLPAILRRMERAGYTLKHTSYGVWFVDGYCGYLVTGYHEDRGYAIRHAYRLIREAQRATNHPSWLTRVDLR